MYILAIETTGPRCSVALAGGAGDAGDGGTEREAVCRVLGEETSLRPMGHLQDLIPLTGRLLDRLHVAKSDISHIAVSAGPGSFTGIRIGVSTARALGQALGLPVIAVPTLDGLCRKDVEAAFAAAAPSMQGAEPVVCGMINARRGQVYGMIDGFLPGCPCMLTDVLEIICSAEGPVRSAGRPVLFFGDGIDAYEKKILDILGGAGMTLGKEYFFAPEAFRYQDAASAGRLAFGRIQAGEGGTWKDVHPDYMRKAEAEQKLEAGELPICRLPKQE